MKPENESQQELPRIVEVVVLERGREVASAIIREDGAPAFRGSPSLPPETRELARVLLSGSAESAGKS